MFDVMKNKVELVSCFEYVCLCDATKRDKQI